MVWYEILFFIFIGVIVVESYGFYGSNLVGMTILATDVKLVAGYLFEAWI